MDNICMIHGTSLNDNGECDICIEEILRQEREELDFDLNSLEDYDDISEDGTEFEH